MDASYERHEYDKNVYENKLAIWGKVKKKLFGSLLEFILSARIQISF